MLPSGYGSGRRTGSSTAAIGPKVRREPLQPGSSDRLASHNSGRRVSEISDNTSEGSRVPLECRRGSTWSEGTFGTMGGFDTGSVGLARAELDVVDAGPRLERARTALSSETRKSSYLTNRHSRSSGQEGFTDGFGDGFHGKIAAGKNEGGSNSFGLAIGPQGQRPDQGSGTSTGVAGVASSVENGPYLKRRMSKEMENWRWLQPPRPEIDDGNSSVTTMSFDDFVL